MPWLRGSNLSEYRINVIVYAEAIVGWRLVQISTKLVLDKYGVIINYATADGSNFLSVGGSMRTDLAMQAAISFETKRHMWKERIAPLITDELIEEHRKSPIGEHSAPLDAVLYFVRGDPWPHLPRLVVIIVTPAKEWAIGQHGRQKGVPILVRPGIYTSIDEIEHTIFLERLRLIQQEFGS